ncbi:MAG: histidine kinase [Ideonella sp.]|jgi:signal transduction histidine kinase|nr:histidine kinase [Ideonella sp.]
MRQAPAARSLTLLHLEDSELDHELTLAHLRRGGLTVHAVRVETESDFGAALDRPWDAVISDYNLPGFTGLKALEIVKGRGSDVPFILLSGEIGEDAAVAAMRQGASDYLLKNNLARLVPAVLQAVEAAETRRARERADRELVESRQRLRELAQHLQTSVEMERAAIAREIHDDVGGSLTALKFDLAWIARHTDSPEVLQRVTGALETVKSAIESSQRIMHNLRPAILEQGLVAALQWMASRFEKRTGVACRLVTPPGVPELPAGVALVAYRTAQEALTNVTKHAQASQVRMDLSLAGGTLSLEVTDNGRGLSHADLAKAHSFGIRGLHERAGTVGGWVDLTSRQGRGTSLILSVPLESARSLERQAPRTPDRGDYDPTGWGQL